VGNPAASERRNQAINEGTHSKNDICVEQGIAASAMQKRGKPNLQPSQRERHHRHAERGRKEGWITEQTLERVSLGSVAFGRIELAEGWLRNKQKQQGQHHSGRSPNVEWSTPAVRGAHVTAQQVSQRRSDRNRQIKHTHNPAAFFNRKHVRDKGWRKNDKACLAEAHQSMTNE